MNEWVVKRDIEEGTRTTDHLACCCGCLIRSVSTMIIIIITNGTHIRLWVKALFCPPAQFLQSQCFTNLILLMFVDSPPPQVTMAGDYVLAVTSILIARLRNNDVTITINQVSTRILCCKLIESLGPIKSNDLYSWVYALYVHGPCAKGHGVLLNVCCPSGG